MTPEIEKLKAEVKDAEELLMMRRSRLQSAMDAYWTDHFREKGIVEGQTLVRAKSLWSDHTFGVLWWTGRRVPAVRRRNKDGSTPRRYFDPVTINLETVEKVNG